MMIDCSVLKTLASQIAIVTDCAQVAPNVLRLTTGFKYPDGSCVDLFVMQDQGDMLNSITLTDLGETTSYLLEMNIRPWKTQRRKRMIAGICDTLNVEQEGGEFKIRLAQYELDKLSDAILRLAQTCIRVSDVSMTQTLRTVNAFKEDIEEFLDSAGYKYETDRMVRGKFGVEVRIDFSVDGPHRVSLLQALTAANQVVGHRVAEDVFTRWYDIPIMKSAAQFITVVDAHNSAFLDQDLRRIEEHSTLIAYPDQSGELLQALAA